MSKANQHIHTSNISIEKILTALDNEPVRLVLSSQLQQSFVALGIEQREAEATINEIIENIRRAENIYAAEQQIKILLQHLKLEERIAQGLKKRARLIYNQINKYVVGPKVLDIGCGDGLVAQLAANDGHEVVLSDVVEYLDPEVRLPFTKTVEGEPLPFSSNSFQTVLLLTVLHHAHRPLQLLSEAVRVCQRRIIIIESVCGVQPSDVPKDDGRAVDFANLGDGQHLFLAVIDWFYNRILHSEVPVPCKFNSPSAWSLIFRDFGMREVFVKHLGIDQPLVPEYHSLHVIEKP